jgi:uncharacterized protein (TIGR00255 family)
MTGFARASGEAEGYQWSWELRSVNGRGLDLRLRLPNGFDGLDAKVRKAAGQKLDRGNLTANLQLARATGAEKVDINWQTLEALAQAAKRLEQEFGTAPASADGLLGLRGVLEAAETEESETEQVAREQAIEQGFKSALDELVAMRRSEGERLAELVRAQMAAIVDLAGQASAAAASRPEAVRQRMQQQLAELTANGAGVSEDRLAQEIALIATKLDVREELDRLQAHVLAITELLDNDGAIGRRLDFLAQELNREANTLCSKSQDVEVTRIGVELKTVVDQFREQAQNIE